ncbi:MAG: DNA polymerase III subunit delta [Chloroflexi bacterium]|nr:DNA polymerase III subunit delta [Chloroflexota bacterium]
MLYILYGPDEFSRREALRKIMSDCGCLPGDSNVTTLEGKSVTIQHVSALCDSIPFFASHRLVLIEGLLDRFSKRPPRGETNQKPAGPDLITAFEDYVKRMPASTILVLLDQDIKPANLLLKRLSPLGDVRQFQSLKGGRLHEWLRQRISEKGGKITPLALARMAEYAGNDLWGVDNEIDKLLLYSDGLQIGEADVTGVMSISQEANKYALADMVVSRRLKQAQKTLHRLLDEGMQATQMIASLAYELSLILRAREGLDQGLQKGQVQERLGTPPGFRTDKILRQARECTLERLSRLYSFAVSADISVKTGAMSEELALDIFLVDSCR